VVIYRQDEPEKVDTGERRVALRRPSLLLLERRAAIATARVPDRAERGGAEGRAEQEQRVEERAAGGAAAAGAEPLEVEQCGGRLELCRSGRLRLWLASPWRLALWGASEACHTAWLLDFFSACFSPPPMLDGIRTRAVHFLSRA
jgi:hypothetical protein